MKPIPKWLMIPPAVAVLLVLGPLTMQGGTVAVEAAGQDVAPAADDSALARPTLPKTPDFWQIGSALIGVLLLGGLGVYGLRRLRGGAVPTRGAKTRIVTLRQTMRLGQRQSLHAIEFEDRILLIGETERGLSLIESAAVPESGADEAEAAARAAAMLDGALVEEDGAVPKDLLIPRPDRPSRSLPKRPASPRLEDFRALLQKAGR